MILADLIEDIAFRLSWLDGDGSLAPKNRKQIIRGLSRLFDRFSIDGRKIQTTCEIRHTIRSCDNRLSIGKNKEFDVWGSPLKIHYAAWQHGKEKINCLDNDHQTKCIGLCDDPIHVRCDVGDYYYNNPDRGQGYGRPSELFYERGEIVFDCQPRIGDTLLIRATMPFDANISDCPESTICDEPVIEFDICPSGVFDYATRQSILREAEDSYDGCKDWSLHTLAIPCGDECAEPVDVLVTAREVYDFCPNKIRFGDLDLPEGYYDTLVKILTYELAPYARITRTPEINADNAQAIKLLHRYNAKVQTKEIDYTSPHTHRQHCHEYDYFTVEGGCRNA